MPELPECEASRAALAQNCCNSRIVRVEVLEQGGGDRTGQFDDVVFEVTGTCSAGETKDDNKLNAETYLKRLMGSTIKDVHRRGKQLWFDFVDGKQALLFHFGMTGCMAIKGTKVAAYKSFEVDMKKGWPPKYTKLQVDFANGASIAFCDPRRLGRIRLRDSPPTLSSPIKDLALDPVCDPLPSKEALSARLQKINAPIKAVLLDQNKVFSGIGNWVADEVLYHSGIHPETKVRHVPAIIYHHRHIACYN
jgi:formamidopyrimidine-DNA glycosylase